MDQFREVQVDNPIKPRRSLTEIHDQQKELIDTPNLIFFLDTYPQESFIINDSLQIIVVNKAFDEFFRKNGFASAYGKRLGEALGCGILKTHGCRECGTSEGCKYCNAYATMKEGLLTQSDAIGECILVSNDGKEHYFDLSITATPLVVNGNQYQICILKDVAALRRKEALEKVFFHDISNSVGSLEGLLRLLLEPDEGGVIDDNDSLFIAYEACCMIDEEIKTQRQLMEAESDSLDIFQEEIEVHALCDKVVSQWNGFAKMYGVNLVCSAQECHDILVTDYNLIRRVLSNLIKNAVEASASSDLVTLCADCRCNEEQVVFMIKNAQYIPEEVQHRLFHRSFSTKGNGRGLGVYSAKLFTENYLNGSLSFISTKEEGTTFYVNLPLTLN